MKIFIAPKINIKYLIRGKLKINKGLPRILLIKKFHWIIRFTHLFILL